MLCKSWVPQREEKNDNNESRNRGYTNQGCRKARRRATIKRAEQNHWYHKGKRRATRKSAAEGGVGQQETEGEQRLYKSKVPQREGKGDNKIERKQIVNRSKSTAEGGEGRQ